jgi:hypothetical protein
VPDDTAIADALLAGETVQFGLGVDDAWLAEQLSRHPPRPDAGAVRAYVETSDRWSLTLDPRPHDAVGEVEALAWAIRELRQCLGWYRTRFQEEHAAATWPDHQDDPDASAVWRTLAAGRPWDAALAAMDLWRDHAWRAFRTELLAHGVPFDVVHGHERAFDECLFHALLSPPEGAGVDLLAIRTLETSTSSGLHALAERLDPEGLQAAARCSANRGSRARTVRSLLTEIGKPAMRATVLATRWEDPAAVTSFMAHHLAAELVLAWSQGLATSPRQSSQRIVQHVGRARSRLRHLLAQQDRAGLAGATATLPSVYARTSAALATSCRTWAATERRRGFSFDAETCWGPRCTDPVDVATLDSGLVRTWVLLAVLRGQLDTLRLWAATGRSGSRSGTWSAVLREVPEALRTAGKSPYDALQAHLCVHLSDALSALRPPLRALAALAPRLRQDAVRRTLRVRVTDAVGPWWDPAVSLPRSGFPAAVRHAASACVTAPTTGGHRHVETSDAS